MRWSRPVLTPGSPPEPPWPATSVGRLGAARGLGDHELLPEHRLVGLAQVRAGIDAQLVGQPPGCRAVRRECVRLATAEVERGHQPPDQALVEWVLPDELLQLGDGPGVLAEGDLGIDQVHPRGQPTGIEAGDQPQGRGALQVGQGRPTPQRERLREQSGRPVGVIQAERVVAGRRQALEVQDVHAVP